MERVICSLPETSVICVESALIASEAWEVLKFVLRKVIRRGVGGVYLSSFRETISHVE